MRTLALHCLTALAAIGLLWLPSIARGESGRVNAHLEPAAAILLGEPQASYFGLGRGFSLRADLSIEGGLAAEVSATFFDFPSSTFAASGRFLGFGAGVRYRLLDDRPGFSGRFRTTRGGSLLGNLWVGAAVLGVQTGPLFRLALEGGVGLELSVWGLQVGPYVRYSQVLQPDNVAGTRPEDARMVWFGVSVSLGFVDTGDYARDFDGDGLVGVDDACPRSAEDLDGFEDEDGCPDPDNDGDAIADAEDRCPGEPGPAANGGCPDQDTDGDGLADRIDLCPDEAGTPLNKGCPGEDSDGDGLVDRMDECPGEPGPAFSKGCPEPDTDGDGFVDRLDKCPEEPEVFNGIEDDDGCPDEGDALVVLTRDRIEFRKKVAFNDDRVRFGSAQWQVSRDSYLSLATVAKLLFLHPEIRKVRVEGHTDNVGSREFNLELSERRARAVMNHLVNVNGVERHRLEARGLAFDRPIVSNDAPAGRARNRRVELVIIERSRLKPTGG